MDANNLSLRYHTLLYRLQHCATQAHPVQLLAVSKQQSTAAIRTLWNAGQRAFAENYVQEALPKMHDLADLAIEWHFIGRLQSNKTKAIAEHFAWVHSLDRIHIAERLHAQRPAHLPPLSICIAMNINGDKRKSGITPAQLPELLEKIQSLSRLRCRGLMSMITADYAQVGALFRELQARHAFDTLSMGMSSDMTIAIAQGSTCVRIGTALFGERKV